ncbi:MAG TPA: exonuclease domain-containing protein [Gaiella sp.]|jgi:DNA polymerase-3 subunit epsilon|nr:exonuclease domain-containing protein [Gaiella sp.]
MQLSFDAADRLVELVEARRGPVPADEAARVVFALASAPAALARSLLDDVVTGDVRLAWRGASVGLAAPAGADVPLEQAHFVVVDLETTGLSPRTSRICEIGAQRVRALELADAFETLVDPRVRLPPAVTSLTGIRQEALRGAPGVGLAIRRLLAFTGDAAVVAHNARFDLAFLDREVELLTGRRVASPVVDTVWLARRLLGERTRRVGLASLAHFFGVPTEPCHRALPDARATAEILVVLVGLAQERGARTLADLVELAAPRARRLHVKRSLVADAPRRPGVYVFRGAGGLALYVGRARDLRGRLRSYFAGGRQRPSVEAALAALERVEWSETGSELEAALEELRLLRELRPPANARGTRPDRHVYLRRRGGRWTVGVEPTPLGPLPGRRLARAAARALDGHDCDDVEAALPVLRARLRRLGGELRFEDAARLRDRVAKLEEAIEALRELERLRGLSACLVVPARQPGFVRAHAIAGGQVAAVRLVPRGPGAVNEVAALVAEARRAERSIAPEDADELRLVASFLRRPPPELRVARLDAGSICAAVDGIPLAA